MKKSSLKSILAIIFILVLSLLLPALSEAVVSDTEQKLTASDGGPDDRFGASVSISSNTLVVGAYLDDDNGENSGSAYVFERISGTWTQVAKLKASDGDEYDSFGASVSISNDMVVVGAPLDEHSTGSAYIFYRDQGGPENWGQVKKITANDFAQDFGLSVSINGDTLVVGTFTTSAFIFYRDEGGPDSWGQVKKITSSDGDGGEDFGTSVSISGDTVVVGAPWGDGNEFESGSAYIFYRDQGGPDNWGEVQKLTASDGHEGDLFGVSVSISDDTVVIGALFGEGNEFESGSAYIFYRDRGGPDNWGEVQKLTASDGSAYDYFGRSTSIRSNTVVVNGPNLVYIFDSDQGGPDNWGEVQKLTASDGEPGDSFGHSVSISGDTVVVGAPFGDGNEFESGSAYVYEASENQPPIAMCQDVTVTAEPGTCIAEASVDDGSYDPDGDPITLVQEPPGPYCLGTTEVTLTVTDDKGLFDQCSATVTVVYKEISVDINIYPKVLNLKSKGKRLISGIRLPEEYGPHDIARDYLELSIPSCSGCVVIYPTYGFRLWKRYLAFFPRQDLIDEIETMSLDLPTKLDLKITGELNDGTPFEGLDTIRVIKRKKWTKRK